jgi:hypothetical protein
MDNIQNLEMQVKSLYETIDPKKRNQENQSWKV